MIAAMGSLALNVMGYMLLRKKIIRLRKESLYGGFYKEQIKAHTAEPLNFDDHYGTARDYMVRLLDDMEPGSKVLELGCYLAKRLNWYAEKYPGLDFTGMDLSPETLQAAMVNTRHTPNLKLVLGDYYYPPFDNRSFDLVYSHLSLYHVPYDDISSVFRKILNLSNKKVVLIEPFHKVQTISNKINLLGSPDKYSHDYRKMADTDEFKLFDMLPIKCMANGNYPMTVFHFERV